MNELLLTNAQLGSLAEELSLRIGQGLERDNLEIACLPTYLTVPNGQQSGRALVIDTGGTNMRAALVTLSPGDGKVEQGPESRAIHSGKDLTETSQVFFDAQARLAQKVHQSGEVLPLGYCFSYPAASLPSGDAKLVKWTKGIDVPDVVGQPVGKLMVEALERFQIKSSGVRVLNDTVASLLGGAHLQAAAGFGTRHIGLILGTGTNMAGVFDSKSLTKIECLEPMVVNLESGNYSPSIRSEFDLKLDQNSANPGFQHFEKAVSGKYLPFLFDLIQPGILDPEKGSAALVELRHSQDPKISETASAVLKRSAQMIAAALAAVATFYPRGQDTAVLGEGTLLWGDPEFVPTVRRTLAEVFPDLRLVMVKQRENVNLLGAACAVSAQS